MTFVAVGTANENRTSWRMLKRRVIRGRPGCSISNKSSDNPGPNGECADGYASRAADTASGLSAATLSKARAEPCGLRRPCSQFCNVATLTPIMRANSDCDLSSRRRIARTSTDAHSVTRPGLSFPRRILPACRTPQADCRSPVLSSEFLTNQTAQDSKLLGGQVVSLALAEGIEQVEAATWPARRGGDVTSAAAGPRPTSGIADFARLAR